MSHVVQERSGPDDRMLSLIDVGVAARFAEERERLTREVICPKRVLEPRMRCAGIDKESKAELANISQPLKRFAVDEPKRQLVDTNVVPEWVAEGFESHTRPVESAFGAGFANFVSSVPELLEVRAEHLGEFLRLLVVLRAIGPGAARVENLSRNSGNR